MGVGSRHAIPSRAAVTHRARGPGGRAGLRRLRQSRPSRGAPTPPRSPSPPRPRPPGARPRRPCAWRAPATSCISPPATYGAQLRPATSGTAEAPIVYQADGAATISAPAGTVSVMLVGVHDVVLRGLTVLAAAPQARVGRQRLAHHARRRHRDQQRRLGRSDQGRDVGHRHALAPGRQRARRLHGDEPGRGHDAQLLDDQRQRQGRPAVQRRRRRPQRLRRRRRRQHDHRQRRRRRVRARHLRRRDGRRLHHRRKCDQQQRRCRHQGRGRPGRGRGQPAHLLDVRARLLGQPGLRDGAVQPHPGPLPARHPDHDRHDRRARAPLEQHGAADRPLDRERQCLGGLHRQRRAGRVAQQPLRLHQPRSARLGVPAQRRSRSSARSPPTRTGTRAPIRTRCAWPGTARACRSRAGVRSRARTPRASTRRRRRSAPTGG